MKALWILICVVLVAELASEMRYCSASAQLGRAEMDLLRGGGAQAKDCTYSCNAANGYINLCPQADNSSCTVCNNGSTTVHYVDMAGPNCSQTGGFTTSPTQTQDCGVKQNGSCRVIGSCTVIATSTVNCTDPPAVCPQGNCP